MDKPTSPVAAPSRRARIQVTKQRRRRDTPELDLRTPSGRPLPY